MERSNVYYLMRQDVPVVEFEAPGLHFSKITRLINPEILPMGSGRQGETFTEWFYSRMISPDKLSYLQNLTRSHIDNSELVFLTHGLSLLNQYWIKNIDEEISWADINLFENDFSEYIGKALVNRKSLIPSELNQRYRLSPEGMSPGNQTKRWAISDKTGERLLIKRDSSGERPVCEVLSYKLASKMDLPCTFSELGFDGKRFASIARCFTSPDTEIVHAMDLFYEYGFPKSSYNSSDIYNYTCDLLSRTGASGVSDYIDKMLTLDYVMCQTDRHYNNFGLLHNIKTNKWEMSPLYDSGDACFAHIPAKFINPDDDIIGKPFGPSGMVSLDEQILCVKSKLSLTDEMISSIEPEYRKLLNQINLSEEKTDLLISSLHTRLNRMLMILSGSNHRVF